MLLPSDFSIRSHQSDSGIPQGNTQPLSDFSFYQKQSDSQIITRMYQNIIYNILIHIESRLKIIGFQFDYHIAAKFQMTEQHVHIIPFPE